MATYDVAAASHAAAAPGTGVISTMIARYRKWVAARRTAAALRELSPSLLADIGIEPGDIDGYADRLAHRTL
ncbi:MAG: DUF1127 domain-containing protein [Pseudomonadota bacterium]